MKNLNNDKNVSLDKWDKIERCKSINQERLGETRIMNCGEIAFVVEYNNCKDIIIQFKKSGELVKCEYNKFKIGEVKSRLTPSVYGVGIVGNEKTKDENGKDLKSYKSWKSMLTRCYSAKLHEKKPTYIGCRVSDEWLHYPNFKKWFDENYYEIGNERMELDKDILHKGNKVYGSNNCIFVPKFINGLFTKNNAQRGKNPIGVYFDIKGNRYVAQCQILNVETNKSKQEYLGVFTTKEEAFYTYKIHKEKNIKVVAEYYKERIPDKLYQAMMNYNVSIDD